MKWLLPLLLCCLPLLAGARATATEVAVLSTLHAMHDEVPAYSQAALAASVRKLAPDVLCIEVTPDRFATRAPEPNKIEYPGVIYSLVESQGYRTYPMEPGEPLSSHILVPYKRANETFVEAQPEQAQAFDAYMEAMYVTLRTYWTSPARVNDATTDAQMRAKHALQEALVGPGEREGWAAWNRQFLAAIDRAVDENPGKRIVVLAGVEHGYWLRERLAGRDDIRLLDTAALLSGAPE